MVIVHHCKSWDDDDGLEAVLNEAEEDDASMDVMDDVDVVVHDVMHDVDDHMEVHVLGVHAVHVNVNDDYHVHDNTDNDEDDWDDLEAMDLVRKPKMINY